MTDPTPPDGGRGDQQPGVLACGLQGLCPRCGARTLFTGPVKFAPACRACGLDFSAFNVGDGPAGFLTLIVGGLITGLAIWLELSVKPPLWVHFLIWIPVTAAAVVGSLRVAKGMLIAAEYRNRAGEHRADAPAED